MVRSSRRLRSLSGVTAVVLGLAALMSAGPLVGSAVAAPAANVTGHVVGVGGAPVGNCSVYFSAGFRAGSGWADADGDGEFSFHAPSGTYDVQVYCWHGIERLDALLKDVELGGVPVDLGDITVLGRVPVSGTVRDSGGTPVADVRINFETEDGYFSDWASTDGAGTYSVNLSPRAYRLTARPGESAGVHGVVVDAAVGPGGLTGLDLTLPPGGGVSGRVTAAGSPMGVEGVTLYVLEADEASPPAAYSEVTTAADGTYTLGGLGTGLYYVVTQADGFIGREVVVDTTAGEITTGVDISLDPATGAIGGVVAEANGQPLDLSALGGFPPIEAEEITSGDGFADAWSWADGPAFQLSDLRLGGSYSIGVNRSSGQSLYTGRYFDGSGVLGAATLADATLVTAGTSTNVGQVRLDTCASVSGRVVDMAQRSAVYGSYDSVDLSVAIFNDADLDLVTRWAPVNADGTFTVTGLLPGEYYAALRTSTEWDLGLSYGSSWDEEVFGGVDPATDGPNVVVSACEPVSGVNFGVAQVVADPDEVVPVTPVRLVDDAVVPAFGQSHCAMVAGAGAPAGATGVLVNVASVSPGTAGNVVLFPDDGTASPQPPAAGASVNFEPGRDVANAAFVKIGDNGRICWYSQSFAASRVVVDVVGFTMADSGVVLQESTRLLDTRPGADHVGELSGGLNRRQVYEVTAAGEAGVPADAKAVVLNVAVVNPAGPGHLRVYPADGSATAPDIATVNYSPGKTKSNAAVVPIGDDGKIALYSDTFSGTPVQVVLDVTGYVAASGETYQTVTPERVLDTRSSAPAALRPFGTLNANTVYSFDMRGTSVVPAEATGVVLNVTAIGPTTIGNLRVYPDADGTGLTAPPNASAINYIQGRDIPNLVVVGIPADGKVNFYSNQLGGGRVDLAVDVVGYTTGATG